jgi:hypothetical protein
MRYKPKSSIRFIDSQKQPPVQLLLNVLVEMDAERLGAQRHDGSGFQLVSQTCSTLAVLTRLTVRLGGRW